MTEKLYYWAENLEDYSSDNESDYDQIIEIKRLNFFIGKNNAGKSRFLRNLFFKKRAFIAIILIYKILMNFMKYQILLRIIKI